MKKRINLSNGSLIFSTTVLKTWNFGNNLPEKYLMIHTCIGNPKKGIRKAKLKNIF